MINNKTFNTVQDLADYVTENHYRAATRFALVTGTKCVWVDEEAGKAWEADDALNHYVSPYSSSEAEYAEYIRRDQELSSRRPKQKNVTFYHLRETGDGYDLQYIPVSSELGEQLAKVLTVRKNSYHDSFTPTTIPGILKRLGNTEIGAQVKAAQKAAAEASARNSRNYVRERARKLATELLEVMKNNPGVVFPAQLTEIAAIENETI